MRTSAQRLSQAASESDSIPRAENNKTLLILAKFHSSGE